MGILIIDVGEGDVNIIIFGFRLEYKKLIKGEIEVFGVTSGWVVKFISLLGLEVMLFLLFFRVRFFVRLKLDF